jgi:thiol:disulfide interchange protein
MNLLRRFLLAAIAVSAASLAAPALALDVQPYTPAALAQAQSAGKPVVLHFHADWCPTCRAQDKSLDALKAMPAEKLDVTVLRVDYDKETELKRQLKVRTQSTFIAYHGATERARLVGGTSVDEVRGLLKAAL